MTSHFTKLASSPDFAAVRESASVLAGFIFVVPRPKSHFKFLKSGTVLHPKAPASPRGDVDNLIKPVLDAMHGLLWGDDTVVTCGLSSKRYTALGESPRAHYLIAPGFDAEAFAFT